MWFSGLRGCISYALSLHLELSSEETRRVMITTTLIIVLFTTLVFGGSTMPLLKYLSPKKVKTPRKKVGRRRRENSISLSKTREWGHAIDSEHLSELTEEDEVGFAQSKLGGFARMDRKYLTPFFTRRFTTQELHDCKSQMTDLTNKWYQAIRITPDEQTDDEEVGNMTAVARGDGGPSRSSSQKNLCAKT